MARQPDRWNTNTPARERSIRVLRSAFASDSLHSPAAAAAASAAAAAAAAALARRPELFRGAASLFEVLGTANDGARCAPAETQRALLLQGCGYIRLRRVYRQQCSTKAALQLFAAEPRK